MNAALQPTLMRIPMRTLSRQARYALEGVDDILVYKVAMTTRFRGVTRREGLLLHGHSGTTTMLSRPVGWRPRSSLRAVSRRFLGASSCPLTSRSPSFPPKRPTS